MKIRALLAAIVLVLGCGLCSLSFAWDVTVSNATELVAKVEGHVDHVFWTSGMGEQTIQPGGSYTWHSGSWCPDGLSGEIRDSAGNWRKIQETSCLGHKCSHDSWTSCCWNLNFKVCRKAGIGYQEIRDDDYGFCKQ